MTFKQVHSGQKLYFEIVFSSSGPSRSLKLIQTSLSIRFIQFSQRSQYRTRMERVHACSHHDHTRWGRGQAGQSGNRKQNDRQRSLPEHLRERGVAVIRPIGQNGSWVRGRWEKSVEDREGGGGLSRSRREQGVGLEQRGRG